MGYGNMSSVYSQAASIIQMRLDTERELDKIEAFLRGTKIMGYREKEGGGMTPIFGQAGVPKMNDQGVQSVMSWLTPLFSAMTVQGNFDEETLNYYIFELHVNFAEYLMTNLHDWAVVDNDFSGIVGMVIMMGMAFFSRLKDNKERESYAQTFRTVESNVTSRGGKGVMGLFKSNG